MKCLLILLIALMCFAPLASATLSESFVGHSNDNSGLVYAAHITKVGWSNISSISTLTLDGGTDYGGTYATGHDKSGTFLLRNQSNFTIASGTYDSQYSGVSIPGTYWTGHMHHVFSFNSYTKPDLDNAWTMYLSNGFYWAGDGGLTTSTPEKASLLFYFSGSYYHGNYSFSYTDLNEPPPLANFTASPLNATAPAYIPFTDTSTGTVSGCTYNWSYTPTTGVLVAPQDLDNEDITMLFTENGDFTISHGVDCYGKSDTETKTDYIHIMNATALSTFRVRAVDAISGYGVNGAQVDVFNIENASWTNQTSVTGEVTVSALTGTNINAYGSATGYDDGESLGLPVVAGSLYPIYMWPTNMSTNVSAGNMTLYVTVLEDGTNTRLSGYSLTVFAPFGVYYSGTTNANGIFQTTITNRTDYNIEVGPQKGHLGAQKIFNSGTQVGGGDAYVEQTIWLPLSTVTTAPTVTTLPGGGTPTTVQTVDPYPCVGDGSYQDTLNCQRKQGEMGADIIKWGPDLVLFFIMLTFIGGIALIWKGFR